MDPKISIITICYNAEIHIEKTIKSVLEQKYNNLEYVIVDGLSNDNTMRIVDKYRDKIDIVISEKDNGISDAFNKGVKVSTGELICFMNAGDYFLNNLVLFNVAEAWKINKEDVIFFQMDAGKYGITPPTNDEKDASVVWKKMQIPHQACFCRRCLFFEIGMFDISYKVRMDYDFFARCVKENKSFRFVPRVISMYDDEGISSDTNNRIRFFREEIAIKHKYGFKVEIIELLKLLKWTILLKIKRY